MADSRNKGIYNKDAFVSIEKRFPETPPCAGPISTASGVDWTDPGEPEEAMMLMNICDTVCPQVCRTACAEIRASTPGQPLGIWGGVWYRERRKGMNLEQVTRQEFIGRNRNIRYYQEEALPGRG